MDAKALWHRMLCLGPINSDARHLFENFSRVALLLELAHRWNTSDPSSELQQIATASPPPEVRINSGKIRAIWMKPDLLWPFMRKEAHGSSSTVRQFSRSHASERNVLLKHHGRPGVSSGAT